MVIFLIQGMEYSRYYNGWRSFCQKIKANSVVEAKEKIKEKYENCIISKSDQI